MKLRSHAFLPALAVAALVGGCAASTNTSTDAGDAVVMTTDAVATTDVTVTTDAIVSSDAVIATDAIVTGDAVVTNDAAITCSGPSPNFPTFDRSCTQDSDCVVVTHQTDCCGNSIETGIARSEQARYAIAEAACDATYPGCGCPAQAPTTDDGMRDSFGNRTAVVNCRAGTCTTTLRAGVACGDHTCGPSQVCAPGCCGIAGCVPPPPVCVDIPSQCGSAPSCGCFPNGNPCSTGSCEGVSNGRVTCLCA